MTTRSTDAAACTSPADDPRALYYQIDRLWRSFSNAYSGMAARAGLSDSAFDVLCFVCELGEGCLQRDVCEQTYLGKQTVNSAVHKLVGLGYLRLEPAVSGRGMRLFLTPEGHELVERFVVPACEADVAAFSSLAPADQQAIVRIEQEYLHALNERFGALAASWDEKPGPKAQA